MDSVVTRLRIDPEHEPENCGSFKIQSSHMNLNLSCPVAADARVYVTTSKIHGLFSPANVSGAAGFFYMPQISRPI